MSCWWHWSLISSITACTTTLYYSSCDLVSSCWHVELNFDVYVSPLSLTRFGFVARNEHGEALVVGTTPLEVLSLVNTMALNFTWIVSKISDFFS